MRFSRWKPVRGLSHGRRWLPLVLGFNKKIKHCGPQKVFMVLFHLPFNLRLYHFPSYSTQSSHSVFLLDFGLAMLLSTTRPVHMLLLLFGKPSPPKTSNLCLSFIYQITCQFLKEGFFNSLIRLPESLILIFF